MAIIGVGIDVVDIDRFVESLLRTPGLTERLFTEHEANHSALFISDKAWSSLTDEQKKWVQTAADEISQKEPEAAFKLEHEALAKLQKMGVKVVSNVDKSGFSQISKPIQDKLANELGPHAVKVLALVRSVQ